MRILYMCSNHPPYDKRVYYKISKTLAANGYEVLNLHPNVKEEKSKDNINIIGFRQEKGLKNRILSLVELYRKGKSLNSKVIIVPEPDSLLVALLLKLGNKKLKVIFDCHEWYEIHYKEKIKNKIISKFLNKTVEFFLSFAAKNIDGIICVNQTMTEKYLKYNNNSFCIPNTLFIDQENKSINNTQKENYIFTGNFCDERQQKILIEAASYLRAEHSKAKITILGGFVKNNDYNKNVLDFNNIIKNNELENNIELLPWLSPIEAQKVISNHLGGITRFDSYLYGKFHCLPNKIFDYMSEGLAIITCDLNHETSKIVKESNCGVLVSEETGQSLAKAIMYLENHKEEAYLFGINARNSISKKYNWANYEKNLLEMIESI